MCKDCFHCMHGQCLELETNTVPCNLFGKAVPNNEAEECDAFTAHVELDSSDVEVITEFQVHPQMHVHFRLFPYSIGLLLS